jgi:ribosomal protein L40E
MAAHYQCQQCMKEWALVSPRAHSCPHCSHVYVRWTNYDEWRKDWHRRPDMTPY